MQSPMSQVPKGFTGLEIYGAYFKDNEFIVLGEPMGFHNCDAMGCGTLDHVVVRVELPGWQAAQQPHPADSVCTCEKSDPSTETWEGETFTRCYGCGKRCR